MKTNEIQNNRLESSFYELWKKVEKREIKTLTLYSGKQTMPIVVDPKRPTTLIFKRSSGQDGDVVTLKTLQKAFYEKGINSLKRISEIKSTDREVLGSQGNTPIRWAVLKYILDDIESNNQLNSSKNWELDDDNYFNEGQDYNTVVKRYERSREARKRCLAKKGYKCYICGFDFEKTYGEYGKEFIEVHHINPVSMNKRETNPEKDLIPICSNCHSIVHRKRNAVLDVEELKKIFKF